MNFAGFLPHALLLIVFLILGIWASRRRQFLLVPAQEQMRKPFCGSSFVVTLPLCCWLIFSWSLVIALADPIISIQKSILTVEGKEAIICVDTSTSMGKKKGEKKKSAMEMVQGMLHEFVDSRLGKGDMVGVSAFGGRKYSRRDLGSARIIQYPSRDNAILYAAVEALKPTMFGSFTAIGDGIFISIIALIESQLRQTLKEGYDRNRFEDAVWNMGSRRQDPEYLNTIVAAAGQQQGRYIVLFTDGIYNTGLRPSKPLWLANRLGLKVHFVAFESTAPTGLNYYEGLRRKAQTIEAVIKSGGIYRESKDLAGVADLFREIDRAEKVELTIKEELRGESRRRLYLYYAAAAFGLWMMSWLLWSDPL